MHLTFWASSEYQQFSGFGITDQETFGRVVGGFGGLLFAQREHFSVAPEKGILLDQTYPNFVKSCSQFNFVISLYTLGCCQEPII